MDEALCFGWIDGVRTGIDEHSDKIRFSLRKPRSIWSAINVETVRVLGGVESVRGLRSQVATGAGNFQFLRCPFPVYLLVWILSSTPQLSNSLTITLNRKQTCTGAFARKPTA